MGRPLKPAVIFVDQFEDWEKRALITQSSESQRRLEEKYVGLCLLHLSGDGFVHRRVTRCIACHLWLTSHDFITNNRQPFYSRCRIAWFERPPRHAIKQSQWEAFASLSPGSDKKTPTTIKDSDFGCHERGYPIAYHNDQPGDTWFEMFRRSPHNLDRSFESDTSLRAYV